MLDKNIPIGVSLRVELINLIDNKRGDISRSRYILRLIESGLKQNNILIPIDTSFDAQGQQVPRN
ncbi:MAG: hypothetical protein H0W19_02360 [Nitrosopumilus sp.]|nr:hypothetical protein [Nitrosopumilus sp.]